MMNKKEFTSKTYWEKYYSHSHAEKDHIENVCSYYDRFWNFLFRDIKKGAQLIEIGGFPGRYLAYLGAKYKIEPTCLDYNSDLSQIENSFDIMGVEKYSVLQEDFTSYSPKQQYDYVISNGFIEHFEDFDNILDLHITYLKPGGKTLIMIPNKRYLRQIYGYLCDYENLKAHNLKAMSLSVFENFANRNNLEVNLLQYYGGFPFSVHQKLNFFQKIIFKIMRICFKYWINPILMKHPSKYFSSTIIGIFQKPL